MKKSIIIAIFAFLTLGAKAQETKETIKWMDFNDAVEACKKEPKLIFIDVFTDWCGWCKWMDASTFKNPVIAKYMNDKFYAVKFDAERSDTIVFNGYTFTGITRADGRKGAHQLAAALLQNKLSYPSYVLMDENFRILQVIGGYQEVQQFEPMIHFFGDRAYQSMNGDDFLKDFKSEL